MQIRPSYSSPSYSRSGQQGFTLLELVMVMTIVLILIAVSVTSYQQIQLKARETVLKQNLMAMRKAIDEFTADRERLPSSLEDLATAHYINEVPIDPITGEADWEVETGEDIYSQDGGTGVVDVRSKASGSDSEGKAYSEY
jgi:general secretion pathway protein G